MAAPLNVPMFNKAWSFFIKPFIHTTVLPPYITEIPLTRVLQVPEWNTQYRQFAKETADLMSSSAMDSRLAYLHELLRPYVKSDPYYSLDMGYTLDDFDKAFDGMVRMKLDYSVKRILGELLPEPVSGPVSSAPSPGIHAPEFLNLEVMGIRPFMRERAWIVREQLSPTCPRDVFSCAWSVQRDVCESRGRATCASGQCVCKPGFCKSGLLCILNEPPSNL